MAIREDMWDLSDSLPAPEPYAGYDPRHHHTPDDDRVFVFGSNIQGWHGGGAAWYARVKLGAEEGVGEGPTGRTYALPTCFEPGLPYDMASLEEAVDTFIWYALRNHTTRFFVSEVGCGLAGFYVSEVAPLFRGAPPNCDLPPSFAPYL